MTELSDHLKATRSRLKDFEHGGLVIRDDALASFIARFDQFIRMAVDLENKLSMVDWNSQGKAYAQAALGSAEAAILNAMRDPNSKVVLFPVIPRPVPKPQPGPNNGGGSAA